jgi:hypothetical protein
MEQKQTNTIPLTKSRKMRATPDRKWWAAHKSLSSSKKRQVNEDSGPSNAVFSEFLVTGPVPLTTRTSTSSTSTSSCPSFQGQEKQRDKSTTGESKLLEKGKEREKEKDKKKEEGKEAETSTQNLSEDVIDDNNSNSNNFLFMSEIEEVEDFHCDSKQFFTLFNTSIATLDLQLPDFGTRDLLPLTSSSSARNYTSSQKRISSYPFNTDTWSSFALSTSADIDIPNTPPFSEYTFQDPSETSTNSWFSSFPVFLPNSESNMKSKETTRTARIQPYPAPPVYGPSPVPLLPFNRTICQRSTFPPENNPGDVEEIKKRLAKTCFLTAKMFKQRDEEIKRKAKEWDSLIASMRGEVSQLQEKVDSLLKRIQKCPDCSL